MLQNSISIMVADSDKFNTMVQKVDVSRLRPIEEGFQGTLYIHLKEDGMDILDAERSVISFEGYINEYQFEEIFGFVIQQVENDYGYSDKDTGFDFTTISSEYSQIKEFALNHNGNVNFRLSALEVFRDNFLSNYFTGNPKQDLNNYTNEYIISEFMTSIYNQIEQYLAGKGNKRERFKNVLQAMADFDTSKTKKDNDFKIALSNEFKEISKFIKSARNPYLRCSLIINFLTQNKKNLEYKKNLQELDFNPKDMSVYQATDKLLKEVQVFLSQDENKLLRIETITQKLLKLRG